jgi:branched-chain amino acid aminotransferase
MNLFIALKTPEGETELVTAPLGDLVLPGVTRDRCGPLHVSRMLLTDSVLNLCRGHIDGKTIPGLPSNLKVSERKITMGDLVEAEKNGSLLEVFGAGTAAIVSAVDK